MIYQHGKIKKRRSIKPLLWLLVIAASVLYGLVVYSWIEEGNRNFEQPSSEREL